MFKLFKISGELALTLLVVSVAVASYTIYKYGVAIIVILAVIGIIYAATRNRNTQGYRCDCYACQMDHKHREPQDSRVQEYQKFLEDLDRQGME